MVSMSYKSSVGKITVKIIAGKVAFFIAGNCPKISRALLGNTNKKTPYLRGLLLLMKSINTGNDPL
jgi:hypothetical protein